jgi:hypothetical protein
MVAAKRAARELWVLGLRWLLLGRHERRLTAQLPSDQDCRHHGFPLAERRELFSDEGFLFDQHDVSIFGLGDAYGDVAGLGLPAGFHERDM